MASTSANVNDGDFPCDKCDVRYNSEDELKQHVNRVHPNKKKYRCDSCDHTAYSKSDLESHIMSNHSPGDYICILCEAYKNTQYQYKQHQEIHRSRNNQNKFSCTTCNQEFKKFSKLDLHYKDRHLNCTISTNNYNIVYCNGQRVLKCKYCEHTTFDKHDLQRHILARHFPEYLYFCVICDIDLDSKRNYDEHHLEHTDSTGKIVCDKCDQKCSNLLLLQCHYRRLHLSASTVPYTCNICSDVHNDQDTLKEHMNIYHTSEHTKQCSACGYRYRLWSTTVKHLWQKHRQEVDETKESEESEET